MQHGSESHLGTLDTGDIVVVDRHAEISDVITYAQAYSSGYTRFGSFGDVILYETGDTEIPILHRALCRLEYNGSFSIPELSLLPNSMWKTQNGTLENLSGKVHLYGIGHLNAEVVIDLDAIMKRMSGSPHGGIITMGDNNVSGNIGHIDQTSLSSVSAPISSEEFLGIAEAEIPWAGTLKLFITGKMPDYMPMNTVICFSSAVLISTISAAVLYITLKRR